MSNADLPREGRGSCIHSRIVRPLTRMQLNCKVQTFMCVFVESVHICVPMCMHVCVLSHIICVYLCDPVDCSLPGSSVHGFSRQEYWSRLQCPPLRIFPTRGWNLCFLCLLHWQTGSLPLVPPGKPNLVLITF